METANSWVLVYDFFSNDLFVLVKRILTWATINGLRLIYRIWSRTWDWPREVVSARVCGTRVWCCLYHIPKINVDFLKNPNFKCMYFPEFTTNPICSYACIHVRVVELCWQSFVIWYFKQVLIFSWIYWMY